MRKGGDMAEGVLHEDDPKRRGNLTVEQYEATYSEEGTTAGHEYPEGLIEKLAAELEAKNG